MKELTTIQESEVITDVSEIFDNLNQLEPEVRITYFPQNVIAVLYKKIKGKEIGSEDINNRLYLRDLNTHFKKLGYEKSHKLLDSLEEDNKEVLKNYHKQLLNFISILKEEFLKGEEDCFNIKKTKETTPEELKHKIDLKTSSIVDYITSKGNIFLYLSGKNRLEMGIDRIQLIDMAHIAISSNIKGGRIHQKTSTFKST